MSAQPNRPNGGSPPLTGKAEMDLAALGRWFMAQFPGFKGPFALRKFSGGQSNPTYLIEAESGAYVLRRRPCGRVLPSAHALDREFRVMSALCSNGFPVPRPMALCNDVSILGAALYVMEFLEGRILNDGSLPGPGDDRKSLLRSAFSPARTVSTSLEAWRRGGDFAGAEGLESPHPS